MPFIRAEPLWHFRHSDVFVDRHVWQRSWLHRKHAPDMLGYKEYGLLQVRH